MSDKTTEFYVVDGEGEYYIVVVRRDGLSGTVPDELTLVMRDGVLFTDDAVVINALRLMKAHLRSTEPSPH